MGATAMQMFLAVDLYPGIDMVPDWLEMSGMCLVTAFLLGWVAHLALESLKLKKDVEPAPALPRRSKLKRFRHERCNDVLRVAPFSEKALAKRIVKQTLSNTAARSRRSGKKSEYRQVFRFELPR